jgi:hypothetical protein
MVVIEHVGHNQGLGALRVSRVAQQTIVSPFFILKPVKLVRHIDASALAGLLLEECSRGVRLIVGVQASSHDPLLGGRRQAGDRGRMAHLVP